MSAFAFEIGGLRSGNAVSQKGGLRRRTSVLTLVALCIAGAPALALDSTQPAGKKIPAKVFTSPADALRAGLDDLQAGDAQSSLEALNYAAAGGDSLARWKLGALYASGELVPRDDFKAYQYFEQVLDNYNEENPDRRDSAAVSKAAVAVGVYSLKGIPNTAVKPDPERALDLFQFAATNFGDADAQYNLGRMFTDGAVGLKNNMRAARWFALAAEKHHRPAEALLGHLLFTGDGVPLQRGRGLMLLTVAKSSAKLPQEQWIKDLFVSDYAAATDDDREAAAMMLSNHDMGEPAPRQRNMLIDPLGVFPRMMDMFRARPPAPNDFAGPDTPDSPLATAPAPPPHQP